MKSLRMLYRALPLTLLLSSSVRLLSQSALDIKQKLPADEGVQHRKIPEEKVEVEKHFLEAKPAKETPKMPELKPPAAPKEPTKMAGEQKPAGVVTELKTKEDLKQAHTGEPKATALKIGADWCGACTMSKEPFKKAVQAQGGALKGYDINADNPNFKDVIDVLNVQGLPTTVYTKVEHVTPPAGGKAEGKPIEPARRITTKKGLKEAISKEAAKPPQGSYHVIFVVGTADCATCPEAEKVANRGFGPRVGVYAIDLDKAEPFVQNFLNLFGVSSANVPAKVHIRSEIGSRSAGEFSETMGEFTGKPAAMAPEHEERAMGRRSRSNERQEERAPRRERRFLWG